MSRNSLIVWYLGVFRNRPGERLQYRGSLPLPRELVSVGGAENGTNVTGAPLGLGLKAYWKQVHGLTDKAEERSWVGNTCGVSGTDEMH